jgi:asparagine synthetase B (glutamine-hydrolysing)
MTNHLSLYPLSNVMVVLSADPKLIETVTQKMHASRDVEHVTRGVNFVVGRTDLPGRPSPPFVTSSGSVWFAEGHPEEPGKAKTCFDAAVDPSARISSLPGDAGFVAIHNDSVTVVRSRCGRVPWYTWRSPSGQQSTVVVSTRNVWIPKLLPLAFEPDPIAHVGAGGDGVFPDRRGYWKGTHVVRAGHRSTGTLGQDFVENCYWDPTQSTPERPVGPTRVGEAAHELRELLGTVLAADLDPAGNNLIGLSGGVDSSCLASLATHQLGIPLAALTLSLHGGSPAAVKEAHYVKSIRDHVQPTRLWDICFSELEGVERCRDVTPLGIPIPHPTLQSLPAINREHQYTVVTGGELADDFFAGPQHIMFDWADAAGPRSVLRAMASPVRSIGRRDLIHIGARNIRRAINRRMGNVSYLSEPSSIFSTKLRAEYLTWRDRVQRETFVYDRPYGGVRIALFEMDVWLAQNWEVCSELGIRRSVPFMDRRVVELACSLHPTDHAMPAKRLLRDGFAGLVPDLNLHRTGKGGSFEGTNEPAAATVTVRSDLAEWLDPAVVIQNEKNQAQLPLDLAWYFEVFANGSTPIAIDS